MRFGIALAIAVLAAPAFADSTQDWQPEFTALDRTGTGARVGAEAALVRTEFGGFFANDSYRFDLHGRYALPVGIGVYASGTVGVVPDDDDSGIESDSGFNAGSIAHHWSCRCGACIGRVHGSDDHLGSRPLRRPGRHGGGFHLARCGWFAAVAEWRALRSRRSGGGNPGGQGGGGRG
jgi:hypothetical protein